MMKTCNTKKYCAEVFALQNKIHKINEKIETLRARQLGGGGLGLGIQKSRDFGSMERLSLDILELEGEAARAKTALLAQERGIKAMAAALPCPLARAIITWRYICRLMWKDIAARAEMSEMQVMREHNAAMGLMGFAQDEAG